MYQHYDLGQSTTADTGYRVYTRITWLHEDGRVLVFATLKRQFK